jgi:hypothetical protein
MGIFCTTFKVAPMRGAHLFILVGPRGSQVHWGMRQWPAMRSRRH